MNDERMKTVFITGASSGIGRASALYLALRGFRVFAGIRKTSDGESLSAESNGNVLPIAIDVTDRRQIVSARDAVQGQLAK